MALSDIETLRLPFQFDPEQLASDLALVDEEEWIAHFNKDCYEGDWSCVALRGPAGATHPILSVSPNPATENWAFTPLAERCQYIAEALRQFECPLQSVRLMRLGPGAAIKEHTDYNLGIEDGCARIHIPILTHDGVRFMMNGKRVRTAPGETWYMNFNLPHSVDNPGPTDRTHLVLDCEANDWLRSLLESAASAN